jgi:predicted thioesterase
MIEPGTLSTLSYVVGAADLASTVGVETGDVFPPVLATARLVALMEVTAARLLAPLLGEGELSVGVTIEMRHSAPTPEGATVEITATYWGQTGALHSFQITATDPGGEVGSAMHERAIVDADRIVARAAKRRG